jgi:hypothetical protein
MISVDKGKRKELSKLFQGYNMSALILASYGRETLLNEIHAGKLIGMQRYAFISEKKAGFIKTALKIKV